MDDKIMKVGITHGDINGISYELLLKTFSDQRMTELCTPVIYGSPKILSYHRKALDFQQVPMTTIGKVEEAAPGRVSIINCISDEVKVELSKATEYAATAAEQAVDMACADLQRGAIDALVTAPVGSPLRKGAEESLAARTGTGIEIYVHDSIRLTLLTNDIPLADVPAAVTCEALSNRLAGFNRSLIRDFNIVRPRIAVLALNPEKPGKAEEEIIIPAISEAVRQGMVALGPYPADTFFSGDYHLMFDGILAMYYDQAMPVFRALTEIRGLRYMAETPAVITSTVHGAAYDIAGQGKASEESLRQAIYTATDIVRNRRNYAEATRNPLRRQYFDKGSAADEKIDLTKEDYPAEAGSDILL